MIRPLRELLESILFAIIIFFFIQSSVQNYRVEGSSMLPLLEEGEMLLVNKLVYNSVDMNRLSRLVPFWESKETSSLYIFHAPDRGDVVVFHFPLDLTREFVKRVIGLPGDQVEIKSGTVYINGTELPEPYLSPAISKRHSIDSIKLSKDQYFVLGDNRAASNDSRDWGAVPKENIVGKLWFVYWPASNLRFFKFFPEESKLSKTNLP